MILFLYFCFPQFNRLLKPPCIQSGAFFHYTILLGGKKKTIGKSPISQFVSPRKKRKRKKILELTITHTGSKFDHLISPAAFPRHILPFLPRKTSLTTFFAYDFVSVLAKLSSPRALAAMSFSSGR